MGSARPEPMSADERADLFREAAENATKQQQHAAREEEDAHWRERQKDLLENDAGAPSATANQSMDDAGTERLLEESEAEELALKCELRRKLAGLRWLPRRMRATDRT